MAQAAQSITPAQFRAKYNLSEGQFKRIKAKAGESLECSITIQDGNRWFLNPEALPVLLQHIPTSPDQCIDQCIDQSATSALTSRRPAPMTLVIDAELVPEVQELQISLPDHSIATATAQLEIANTAHVSSGNRNLRRQLRRKAMIEQAQRDAVEDFAAADRAYEAMASGLEQQQLNRIGIGTSASPVSATEAAPAPTTEAPAKKPQQ